MNDTARQNIQLVRRENFLSLYADFLRQQQQLDPEASVSGLSKSFAEKIQIAGSSFSSIKSGARSIGDKVARQIEANLRVEQGCLDIPQSTNQATSAALSDSDLADFLEKAKKTYLKVNSEKRKLLRGLIENFG